jgi:hypothetical protein
MGERASEQGREQGGLYHGRRFCGVCGDAVKEFLRACRVGSLMVAMAPGCV